jgi:hypothetical protein
VADSDNNRIRAIAGGNVSTLAGNSTEGFSGDAGAATSASLDTPRAVTSAGAEVAFADTENNVIRIVDNGTIHTIGGQPPQKESIVIGGPLTVVYGTGTLTATFSNGGQTATGLVTFYDGEGASPATIGSASLSQQHREHQHEPAFWRARTMLWPPMPGTLTMPLSPAVCSFMS